GGYHKFFGGGIYLNGSLPTTPSTTPVITRNTIDGNRAVPPNGGVYVNYGMGAGIYSGGRAHPTISQNVIRNNVAGDASIANTVGFGGGISVYALGTPTTVITRNLISGNTAGRDGAGVYVGIYYYYG